MTGPYVWLVGPVLLLFLASVVWTIANKVVYWTAGLVGPPVMLVAHMVATGMVVRRSILVRRALRAADGLRSATSDDRGHRHDHSSTSGMSVSTCSSLAGTFTSLTNAPRSACCSAICVRVSAAL